MPFCFPADFILQAKRIPDMFSNLSTVKMSAAESLG